MENLTLTSNYIPRISPPLLLDNIQLVLPLIVENPTGLGHSIPLPPSLWHICEGRTLWVGPTGNIRIGKYDLNSNGTKLLYGEIGKRYRTRSKNQNFFMDEDFPLIKKFLNIPQDKELPNDLYRYQLKILSDRLEEIRRLLIEHGFKTLPYLPGFYRLKRIKRLEICQDFLAPTDPNDLIKRIDALVSEREGEPRQSTVERSKKFSRQPSSHYWDIKPTDPYLRGGLAKIKLYQKDRFVRIEVSCVNIPLRSFSEDCEPFSWLRDQIASSADAAATYLASITEKLFQEEPKINDLDRAALIDGLKLYSPTLKYSDETVRIFVESIMDRQVYAPTAHKGQKIGKKSLKNLSDPELGICIRTSNEINKSTAFVLRKDWKEQLEKKKIFKNGLTEALSKPVLREDQTVSSQISRRDFILGRPLINFLRKPI